MVLNKNFLECLLVNVISFLRLSVNISGLQVAVHVWGSEWVTRRIEFLSDNESVVAVLKSGTS